MTKLMAEESQSHHFIAHEFVAHEEAVEVHPLVVSAVWVFVAIPFAGPDERLVGIGIIFGSLPLSGKEHHQQRHPGFVVGIAGRHHILREVGSQLFHSGLYHIARDFPHIVVHILIVGTVGGIGVRQGNNAHHIEVGHKLSAALRHKVVAHRALASIVIGVAHLVVVAFHLLHGGGCLELLVRELHHHHGNGIFADAGHSPPAHGTFLPEPVGGGGIDGPARSLALGQPLLAAFVNLGRSHLHIGACRIDVAGSIGSAEPLHVFIATQFHFHLCSVGQRDCRPQPALGGDGHGRKGCYREGQ